MNQSTPKNHRRVSRVQQSFHLSSRQIGTRATQGALLTGYSSVLRAVLTIGSTAVLARLLSPEDFGLAAMASLVLEMIGILGYFGFSAALIRSERITRLDLDSAFWLSILVGAILGVILLLVAPFTGLIFNDERVAPLVAALSILPILEFGGVVQAAVISRLMLFRLDLHIQLVHIGVRSAAAIGFAWYEFGVWSLVLGGIVGRTASLVFMYAAIPFVPRIRFSRRFMDRSLAFSTKVFANNLIWYVQTNIDYFIVGRLLGPTQLGFYQAGYRLADEIKNRVIGPLQKVLFPAFAALRKEPERQLNAYLRSVGLLAVILAPIGLGMAAVAHDIVRLLFGSGWDSAANVMTWIGPFVVFRAALSAPTSSLLLANDLMTLSVRLQLIALALCGVAAVIGIKWGTTGVAMGIGIAALLWMPIVMHTLQRTLDLSAMEFLRALGVPFVAATAMAIFVYAAGTRLPASLGTGVERLILLVLIGAAIYAASILLFARSHVNDLRLIMGKLIGKRSA